MRTNRSHSVRHRRKVAVFVIAGLGVVTVPSIASADPGAPTRPVPPRLGRPPATERNVAPPDVSAEVPPASAAQGTDPFATRIAAIYPAGEQARDAAERGGDTATAGAIAAALSHVQQASDNWNGSQTDVVEVVGILRRVVAEDLNAVAGDVTELRGLVIDLASTVVRRFLDHAVASGADERSRAQIEGTWIAAQDAFAAGDAAAGMEHLQLGTQFVSAKLVFDLPTFSKNIEAAFAFPQLAVGSAYAIYRDGALAAFGQQGFARVFNDGAASQDAAKEMNIASVSKTLTAALTIRKLDELTPLGVDAPIAPYLPEHWTLGIGVASLTFRDLMSQRSGLDQYLGTTGDDVQTYSGLDYAGLKKWIAYGVNKAKTGNPLRFPFEYQNQNFAIMRVMLPKMYGLPIQQPDEVSCHFMGPSDCEKMKDDWYAASTDSMYRYLMNQYVFNPVGINGDCRPSEPDNTRTLLYRVWPVNPVHQLGYYSDNWRPICGGGGWHLSALELAKFGSALRNGTLLTPAERQLMDTLYLGWMDPLNYDPSSPRGPAHYHGGDLGCCYPHEAFDSHEPGPFTAAHPKRGLDSCLMSFPNNVQASILVNSQGVSYPGGPYQCAALQTAWQNAWVWQY
jgi:hypothetical protein